MQATVAHWPPLWWGRPQLHASHAVLLPPFRSSCTEGGTTECKRNLHVCTYITLFSATALLWQCSFNSAPSMVPLHAVLLLDNSALMTPLLFVRFSVLFGHIQMRPSGEYVALHLGSLVAIQQWTHEDISKQPLWTPFYILHVLLILLLWAEQWWRLVSCSQTAFASLAMWELMEAYPLA